MKVIKRVLITIVAMGAIIVAAYGVDKGISLYNDKVFEEEREQRYIEVTKETETRKEEIKEISQLSTEEIEEYIDQNAYVDDERTGNIDEDPWNLASDNAEPAEVDNEDDNEADNVPDNEDENEADNEGEDETDKDWEAGSVKDNVDRVAQLGMEAVANMNSVSNNSVDEADTVSGNSVSGNSVSGNSVSGNSVSGNSVSGNSVSGNSVSGNTVSGNSLGGSLAENKIYLADRQKFRTSSEETQLWMSADEEVIKNNTEDFSSLKIACLGDSITDATNLADVYSADEYRAYSYPARLGELLGAQVSNYGIGGSSYGRYWDKAFCERYQDIPEDTDMIIIMGGANDGFCLHEDMVGSMDNREQRTLYGDLDELMRGLKENYPDAEVIFMTPMPNLLHDVLRKDRPELLSQTVIVDAVTELAAEYGYSVIDLYNSNFFDSHDADIVSTYIPDSVHPNEEGYEIFAKHVAAEIMRIHENENVLNDESEDELSDEDADESKDEDEEDSKDDDEDDAVIEDPKSEDKAGNDEETENESDDEGEKPASESKKVIYARE